MKNVA